MMIAALVLIVIAAALSVLIGFANGMADTPMERPLTFRLPAFLLLVAFALFICSRAIAAAADVRPDPELTPGATDSRVTQDNIQRTICRAGYTASVRPPASYTNRLKRQQLAALGWSDQNPRDYEEDHFIPLEIGGNPTDPKNLWPMPLCRKVGRAHQRQDRDAVEARGLLRAA